MRFIYALLIILLSSFPTSIGAAESYKLSMLPRYSSEEINKRISPLAEYLAQKTGANVEAVITSDFAQYEQQLKSGSIAMGYENPYIYTLVSETHEALAMAVKGKDQDKFRGIIIARKDSGLAGVEDLRGKLISIVGNTSVGGYLSQKLTLADNGVAVENDCDLEVASDNKQENVIISVSIGDVDAGFIRESALHIADQYIQPGTIRVVAPCAWLPNWALSVNRSLPSAQKEAIKAAMIGLAENSPVLKAMDVTGFKPASDSQYDVIRRVLEN